MDFGKLRESFVQDISCIIQEEIDKLKKKVYIYAFFVSYDATTVGGNSYLLSC